MDEAGQARDRPPGGGEVARLVRAHDRAATPLGPVGGWPRALRAVAGLMLASPLVSMLACGPWRVLPHDDLAARLHGGRHPGALGRPLADAVPGGYAAGSPRPTWWAWRWVRTGARGPAPPASDVRWDLRRDGARVLMDGETRHPDGPGGASTGFLGIGRDAGRRGMEAALRASDERFRRFAEASSDVLWIRNARTLRFEYVSPAFEAVYGDTFGRVFAGNDLRHWAKLILPEDRGDVMDAIRRVRAGGRVTHEFRIRRPSDGALRWIRDTGFPLRGEDGRVQGIAGIGHDATDEKRAETALRDSGERLQVLVAELQHRSRNLLGVVRSVASKTVGQGGSVESFEDRLSALSRAQGQLSRSGGDCVELEALVRAEIEAHVDVAPPKVVLRGPKVILTVEQVQTFALALHELATNAVKYGALRDEGGDGRLSVTWVVAHGGGTGGRTGDGVGADGASRLVLDWVETGVDARPEREARRGFGRELIERALTYSLRAHTSYAIGPDGVRCRIELPLRTPG